MPGQKFNERVRKWIADELATSGKSRKELAQALGLAPSGVTRLLNGDRAVSLEELVRLSHFFGNPESYLHLMMEMYPGYKLERPPGPPPSHIANVEDHVSSVRAAMASARQKIAEAPGVWLLSATAGDSRYDFYLEDRIAGRIALPPGLPADQNFLCFAMPDNSLSPRYQAGDPVFLTIDDELRDETPVIFCEFRVRTEDGKRPFVVGAIIAGDPETGVLRLRHPVTKKERDVLPSDLRLLLQPLSQRELFGLSRE